MICVVSDLFFFSIIHKISAHVIVNTTDGLSPHFLSFSLLLSSHRLLSSGSDGLHAVGVPDDHIGIGAHGNPAFAWIKVEDFRCIGRSDSNKLVFVHLPHGLTDRILNIKNVRTSHRYRRYINAHHSFVPDESHPLFNPIGPLWDQGEVIFANCFLGSVVCTVSTAHHLEVPAVQIYMNSSVWP